MENKNLKTITKITYALLALACFALSPSAQSVVPARDGGYPDGNTAEGDDALFSLTTGNINTAVGFRALLNHMEGPGNTAIGYAALSGQRFGLYNTAVRANALVNVENGCLNTATGAYALYSNRFGGYNTANGYDALSANSIGYYNTVTGADGLSNNTTDGNNTADGHWGSCAWRGYSGFVVNSGSYNTAIGVDALSKNTTANYNTATGYRALLSNATGIQNAANGALALSLNTTGNGNVAEGTGALHNNSGSLNVAIGYNAGANLTTGSNNIDIALGVAGESNTMRIGTVRQTATFVAGIRGITTGNANAVPVLIDSAGQLGTASSSRRFKHEIKAMDKTSEAIFTLKSVTFQYKSDKTATPQFGLIAEEVAAVNPNLVVRDEKGEIYTVRYDAVNAMLLNEFLKEHKKVEQQDRRIREQETRITELKSDLQATAASQQKQIEALTEGLQKVSAQLEVSRPAPQVASENP